LPELAAEKHKIRNELTVQINSLENKKKLIESKLLESKNAEKVLIKLSEEYKHTSDSINRIEKEIGKKNKENIIFEKEIKSNNEKITKLKIIEKPTRMSSKQISKKIEGHRKNEELLNNAKLEIEKMISRSETLSKILGDNAKLVPEIISKNIKKCKEESLAKEKQLKIEEKNGANLQKIKTQLEIKIEEIGEN